MSPFLDEDKCNSFFSSEENQSTGIIMKGLLDKFLDLIPFRRNWHCVVLIMSSWDLK